MRPRQSEHSQTMTLLALELVFVAALVFMAGREFDAAHRRAQLERKRNLELEEQLEKNRVSMDGMLERITELQGGQPASE